MSRSFLHICRFRLALLLIAPLFLSGCLRGLGEGDWSIPTIFRVKGHTDAPRPPVKLCPEPAGAAKPAGKQEKPQEPCPPVEEKLLPRELPPQSPEQLMPIAPPAPAKPPEKPQSSVAGPPRRLAAAAAPDFLYGDALLTEDVAWRGEVLVEGVVTVAPQATLTIGPGTVIRFGATGGLLVRGRVAAGGTKELPVLFTSRFAEPMAGDWQGIVLLGSDKKNLLENCRLEGAETGLDASFSSITLKNLFFARCGTGARLQDTVLSAEGGGASGCEAGMVLADSEAELRDPLFSGNRTGLAAERSSLYLAGGTFTGNGVTGLRAGDSLVQIKSARFTANGAGLVLASSQGSVAGCRIADNADCGIALAGSRVKVFGNEIASNGNTGLRVEDGRGGAWGNAFAGNGGYDLYNAGTEEFRAMGNWWGGVAPAEVAGRIYDRRADSGRGRVLYLPLLAERPTAIP